MTSVTSERRARTSKSVVSQRPNATRQTNHQPVFRRDCIATTGVREVDMDVAIGDNARGFHLAGEKKKKRKNCRPTLRFYII